MVGTNDRLKVMICPRASGLYLDLLSSHLRRQNVDVKMISWFGKQAPLSFLQVLLGRVLGYQVIHLNWMPFNNLTYMKMLRRVCGTLGLRMVWTVHNLVPHAPQFGSEEEDKWAMGFMADWAREGVVHSERTREEFITLFGARPHLNVIPHGSYVDLTEMRGSPECRRTLNLPQDKVLVLMYGPSRWNKGVRTFLEVVEKLPDNYLGVLAGNCKDPEIRNLIMDHQARRPDKFVVNLDYLSQHETATYFGASDVFFMPFEEITSSSSIIEAISYGKAVVTTDHGDMYMLVENGVNGYRTNDKVEMVERIASIDRAKATEMGERSYQIARGYSWKDAARAYIEVFRSVENAQE